MSTTTLERSHSCTPSTTHSMASPRPSSQRDTPPSDAELSLFQMNDRMNQLDSRFLELRSLVLTKDGYVDRRNREDEHIRRQFENHRAVSDRIDMNVVSLRSDVTALRSDMTTLRADVDRIDSNVAALRFDMDKRIGKLEIRLDSRELKHFNYFARAAHAQIRPVPVSAGDGSVVFPKWFPRTIWKFWCLKKRSRLHRLIELAEFYQLGDYQDWSRIHAANQLPDDSDGSDSSDAPLILSRADAVRHYPEAAHQALGVCIGVAYHKLHIIVGDVPHSVQPRAPKRQQEDERSTSAKAKSKPVKMARRPNPSIPSAVPPPLQHLLRSTSESKSSKSEEQDVLGWKPFPDAPEDIRNNPGLYDPNTVAGILRSVEQGLKMLQYSASERARMSPTGTRASRASRAADPEQAEVPTVPNTVPTEPMTSLSDLNVGPGHDEDIPPTASRSDSSAS